MLYNSAYTPATLNTWLNTSPNNGYASGCQIIWGAVPCGASLTASGPATYNDWNGLYNNVTTGKKAIVNVDGTTAYGHWILVYAFTGTAATKTVAANYKVYDPWQLTNGLPTLAGYSNGFKNAKYYTMLPSFSSAAMPATITGACGSVSTTEIISWSSVAGATGYEVSIKKASLATWTVSTTTALTKTFTGLTKNTTYNIRVRAFQCNTYGAYKTYNFTTPVVKEPTAIIAEMPRSIYPNPVKSNSTFKLSLDGYEGIVRISVVSLNGQIITSQKFDPAETSEAIMNAPDGAGLYILRVEDTEKQSEIQKLIVY